MPGLPAQAAYDDLIAKHAAAYGVPETLVRRVIRIESRGNPRAVSKGNYGLMQIRLGTARAMGYHGTAQGLLDANTNMTYAVKYLAGAYRAAGCNDARAIKYYQRGYHRARRARCSPSQLARIAGRNAETVGTAVPAVVKPDPAAAPVNPEAVLKPRVVQTIAITKSKREALPKRTVAKLQQPLLSPPLPRANPNAVPVQSIANAEPVQPAPPSVTAPETQMIPLPPVRKAELQPAPKKQLRPVHRSKSKRVRARKKVDEPASLLAYLKKLVTPETKQSTRNRRAPARRQARR